MQESLRDKRIVFAVQLLQNVAVAVKAPHTHAQSFWGCPTPKEKSLMQTTTLVTIGEFLLDLDPSRPSLGLEHELAVHFTSASVSLEMCYAKVLLDACALADSKWAAQAPTFASLSACACRPMGITSEIVDLHFHSPTAMRFTGSLLFARLA